MKPKWSTLEQESYSACTEACLSEMDPSLVHPHEATKILTTVLKTASLQATDCSIGGYADAQKIGYPLQFSKQKRNPAGSIGCGRKQEDLALAANSLNTRGSNHELSEAHIDASMPPKEKLNTLTLCPQPEVIKNYFTSLHPVAS